MKRPIGWAAVLVVVISSCAGGARPLLSDELTSAVTPTAEPTPAPPPSSGAVTVGNTEYPLDFRCFDVDGDATFAVGKGVDPAGSGAVTALVQVFPGTDYVALIFGDVSSGRAWEPALDQPVDLTRAGNTLQADGISFVEFDGEGIGEAIGLGSVVVECEAFEVNVPDDVFPTPG